ncbi:hypothetical protein LDENG_00245590, partial [Lucifuga dentata]
TCFCLVCVLIFCFFCTAYKQYLKQTRYKRTKVFSAFFLHDWTLAALAPPLLLVAMVTGQQSSSSLEEEDRYGTLARLLMYRRKYFTPTEVSAHSAPDDLWVSFLGKVCDVTALISQYKGDVLLLPIIRCAGKDISHWFDPETKDVLTYVDPVTTCVRYYTPTGRFLHVPPAGPRSDWSTDFVQPWWRDRRYQVGWLTVKTRWIRIVNTLTSQEQRLEVCSEETLAEILQRYMRHNAHASSYTWKYAGAVLDMSWTLSQNGVPDQDQDLERLRLDRDLHTPAILLYFNDDLTEG